MLIVERQQRLLDMLKEQKTATLEQLAESLSVSASTVRRDLDMLEKQGVVERTHGGAVYRGQRSHPVAFDERLNVQVDSKKAIGRYAASLVEPGMTLLLDGGSTVYLAAQQITARPLQIVTNSLTVANLFANDEQVEVVLIGGTLYPRTAVMVGPLATGCLSDLHADLLLFSVAGVYDDECYNLNLDQAEVEKVMLRQVARSVMLMDSTKFGRKSLARVCSLDEIDVIVTDPGISERWSTKLGDRLVIAQ
jgi:DeoR/GlpR family transcriptional regulator of sugar metabolism